MKKILISIRPQWVAKILNGDKTIEVRRGTALYNAINRLIKEQGKAPCLIYCTREKGKFDTLIPNGEKDYLYGCPYENFHYLKVNGKVIAEFEASADQLIFVSNSQGFKEYAIKENEQVSVAFEAWGGKACLTTKQATDYLGGKDGTAIHVHNLKIFDKPKELKEFYRGDYDEDKVYDEVEERLREYEQDLPVGSNVPAFSFDAIKEEERFLEEVKDEYRIKHAPQSWRYCEVEE